MMRTIISITVGIFLWIVLRWTLGSTDIPGWWMIIIIFCMYFITKGIDEWLNSQD